uniref:Uncharacterized protein n=1 Tax=Anguilla anguilla TaxID=7936 RepID=A0A0E9SAU9_ANGAN
MYVKPFIHKGQYGDHKGLIEVYVSCFHLSTVFSTLHDNCIECLPSA